VSILSRASEAVLKGLLRLRPPKELLYRQLAGSRIAQGIFVITRLGIPDLLAERPRSAAELAETTRASAGPLARVLRLLVLGGLLTVDGERFALSRTGELLRSDHPESARHMVLWGFAQPHWRAEGALLDAVTGSKTPFTIANGKPLFDYLRDDPEYGATFDAFQRDVSGEQARAIIGACPFESFATIVDVGGGGGRLLAEILRRHPEARGTLLDLPHVVERARSVLADAGVLERCTLQPGDFFQAVPEGGAAYVMKYIIHDWDDERALAILKNCRRAMRRDARLFVCDYMMKDVPDPHSVIIDIETLLVTEGGRERTEREFRELFAEAGFTLECVTPTDLQIHVLEARPKE
jgi:hypothetical protein